MRAVGLVFILVGVLGFVLPQYRYFLVLTHLSADDMRLMAGLCLGAGAGILALTRPR